MKLSIWYLLFVSTVLLLGICNFFFDPFPKKASAQTAVPFPSTSACTFTKGDQNPKALPYQSPALVNYFQEVSQKTGVPAALLAGFARVESTTKQYSISNYSDTDVKAMENTSSIVNDIDKKIDGVKALCPVSQVGALGLMQIMPPASIGNDIIDQLKKTRPACTEALEAAGTPCWRAFPGGHPESGVRMGAEFAGKDYDSLTVQDYCNPKTSLYLAAGVILKKLQQQGFGNGTKWDPTWNTNEAVFNAAAEGYYGCLRYPSCSSGPNSYGKDLWDSFQACKNGFSAAPSSASSPSSTVTSGGTAAASNEVITRVGNPACTTDNAIQSAIDTIPGKVAVMVILPDGSGAEKNAVERVPAYSVIKLWIAAAVLDAVEKGRLNLSEVYTVKESDVVKGTGSLQNETLPTLKTYDDLLDLMLTSSDNTATNILVKKLGGIDEVNKYIKANGYDRTEMRRLMMEAATADKDNVTSAEDATKFMQNLFAKKVVNEQASQKLIQLLEKRTRTENKDAQYVNRGIDAAAGYAGKNGTGSNPITRNDVGSFLDKSGNRVYVAVFMTNQISGAAAETAIQTLGQKLYDTNTANASTASCVSINPGAAVHYCQGDPQWGSRCAMAYAGCGPTSMAMVLTSFGDTILPPDMDEIFNRRGWRACGNVGSYMGAAVSTYLPERGYTYKQLSYGAPLNLVEAKQYLDDGYLIIGSVTIHIFVVDGVNIQDNTVHLRDPALCGAAGVYWAPNSAPWRGYGWYYAYAVKKIASTTTQRGVE